ASNRAGSAKPDICNFGYTSGRFAARRRQEERPESVLKAIIEPIDSSKEWLGGRSPIPASVSRRFTLSDMDMIASSVDDTAGPSPSGLSSRSRCGSARATAFGLAANFATQMILPAALHEISADWT